MMVRAHAETYYDCDGNCLNDADSVAFAMNWVPVVRMRSPVTTTSMPRMMMGLAITWPARLYRCRRRNYNPNALYEDGSCDCCNAGCANPSACNYNPDVLEDDGSCDYTHVLDAR